MRWWLPIWFNMPPKTRSDAGSREGVGNLLDVGCSTASHSLTERGDMITGVGKIEFDEFVHEFGVAIGDIA